MMSSSRADVWSEGRNSRANSAAGCLRQLLTILSVPICLQHQLVPRVMMTLLHLLKKSAASDRALFAFSTNSIELSFANEVWWENEHIL